MVTVEQLSSDDGRVLCSIPICCCEDGDGKKRRFKCKKQAAAALITGLIHGVAGAQGRKSARNPHPMCWWWWCQDFE
jgi:hypothetical protein